MTLFQPHTHETVPSESAPILRDVEKAFGFIPNLLGVLAEAPAAARAYLDVSAAFERSSLSRTEQQVVLLTTSFENECAYCMAAHSTIADLQKLDPELVEALRSGTRLADPKLQALREFTRRAVSQRGHVAHDVQGFLDAGFTKAQVLEVLVGVTQKTLSNYTNHLSETPLDEAFAPRAWSKPEPAVAG
jgi:uncharacterized peroxidase-related enzyme